MQTPEPTAAAGQPAIPTPFPRIGALIDDAYFAGIARGNDGAPDYAVLLSPARPGKRLDWKAAVNWAHALGPADTWALPTRVESALLFANLKDQFEPTWHWTGEEESRSYAWDQFFGNGGQNGSRKSYEACARAVRRLPLESLIPSAVHHADA